jgi:hypothetical protein
MSIFRGSKQQAITPDYTGLQIQTAVSTLPIPIVWGTARIAPNLIWYANFRMNPSGGGGGGGKGGLFDSNGQTTYSADIIMALCEGPITGMNLIWRGQGYYTLATAGLALFLGTTPQTAWNYLISVYGYPQDLGYQGTAYVAAANYQLTSSATIDNHNFETMGFRYGTGYGQTPYTQFGDNLENGALSPAPATGYFDADPSLCIYDFLTSAQFGVGLPAASIDQSTLFTQGGGNDASVQTYCRALGIALSPALTDQEAASSILARWLQLINTAAVWSNGTLRFIPYGDTSVAANGISYVPDTTPLYNLGNDDYIVEDGHDPLQVSVSDLYEAYNVWRLEYSDRTNQYALTTAESRDQNAIEFVAQVTGAPGIRLAPTVTAHEICDPLVASLCGQLMMQRAVYIRNTYKFRLSWEYCLLDPMDLVTVTDAVLGLDNTAIRITEIDEDENGYLEITAEEYPPGVASAVLYPVASAAGNAVNRNAGVGSVNVPIIFEPTDELGGGLQIWAAVSSANALYGGCNVWVAYSAGGSYSWVGTLNGNSNMGVTIADLPPVAANPVAVTIDGLNTLAVDLTQSNGALAAASQSDIVTLDNPCYVGGEVVCFGSSTLAATNKYNLTGLVRGAYGTEAAIVDHPGGTAFARLDNVFKYAFSENAVGQTLYFKFQSFNAWGGGVQSLADCAAYPYSVTGSALLSPLPNVTDVYSNYEAGFQKVYWDQVSDFRSGIDYEIRQGANWNGGLFMRLQAHPPFIAPGNGTYWIAARCQPVAGGPIVYSEAPVAIVISGNQLSLTYSESFDEVATLFPGTRDYGLNGGGTGTLTATLSPNTKASAAAASGNQVALVSLPSLVGYGFGITDSTTPGAIPAGASVQSVDWYASTDYGALGLLVTDTLQTIDNGLITGSVTTAIDDGAVTDTVATVTLSVEVSGVLAGDAIALSGVPINVPLYYEPPNAHWLTSSYLANAAVNANAAFLGTLFGTSFLGAGDFLDEPDFLGLAGGQTAYIQGWVEIASATNLPSTPHPQWGRWQQFTPGVFPAAAWKLRIGLESLSPAAVPTCTAFSFATQLATRTDNYVNVTVPASGMTIVFTPDGSSTAQPFNSGVNGNPLPRVQVDWQASAGDTYQITGLSLAQLTIAFFNGGSAVARTATLVVQGA